jgi:integrase
MPANRVTVYVCHQKDRPNLVLQWLDPETGRRKSKSAETADPKQAETARADLESDLNNGRYQEASRMTWERFRELFEEEYVSAKRPNTQQTYASCLDLFERLCNPRQLRSISERTLSAFAAAMRKQKARGQGGYAGITIKVTLQYLRAALRWAARQKLILQCPAFPEAKVPKKKPQPVPAESFERLLAKAPDAQMRAFLQCGWLAGLRLAEALALEWEPAEQAPYLDLSRRRIVLLAEFVKAAEDQWVPLDPLLQEVLTALPRQGLRVFHFVARNGWPHTKNTVSTNISRLAKKVGVKLTMHSLRRGFGCRYAGKVPAQVLQKLMRHSNISITMAYYANVDDTVEAAVFGPGPNAIPNNRGNPAPPASLDSAASPSQDEGISTADDTAGQRCDY